jgi:bacterial/archaeal transporter family protein
MERWVLWAALSAGFAGLTSVFAKQGLDGISGQLGLAVRTCLVFAFVLALSAFTVPAAEVGKLTAKNLLWLGLSAVTTTASWVLYYWALKDGDVGTVALIDKSSFVVAVVLGWVVLKDEFSWRVLAGAGLILAGVVVAGWKR